MCSNNLKNKTERGFTYIELMISVAIIALVSGIFFANYKGANKRSELINSAQKMASDIRLMQSYALGLKRDQALDWDPVGGWGIYIEDGASSYTLFTDSNDPSGNQLYDPGETFREITFPNGMTVAENGIIVDGTPVENATVVFYPPEPITYINTSSTTDITIRLQDINNSISIVKVNFLGLIDVE